MSLYPSKLAQLSLRGHTDGPFFRERRFSVSQAVSSAHAHPRLREKQDTFFAAQATPHIIQNLKVCAPHLIKLYEASRSEKIFQHMELVSHIAGPRSRGFFHRDFLESLTSEELLGMDQLYQVAGHELFHQAFINSDWFSDNSGIANYRLLFSIAGHMDDPGIRHSITDLLIDGHQIHAEGALISMLFALRRKKDNPQIAVEWQDEPITYVGINKEGPITPLLRLSEISFDYYDPTLNTGYEIKITKSFSAASRPLDSVNSRRLQNQVVKYATWLGLDPTRKAELVFIGVPHFALMAHMANVCPKDVLPRFQVSIYPGFLTAQPILNVPLDTVISNPDFYQALGQKLRPIDSHSEVDTSILVRFIHDLKNRLFHASSFLGQLILIAERFEAVSEFLQLNSHTDLANSLVPLMNEVAHNFRTLPSKEKNLSDAEISHIHALTGIVLASLRDLIDNNYPDATLDCIIKTQKLLLVMKAASNLYNLDLF